MGHHGVMARVLLLLPTATYRASDFGDAARALGAEVVVGTERKLAISSFTDASCLVVDLEHPEAAADAIATFAERRPLDAIVGVDDQGVLAAAHAARRLRLPHNDPAAVAATRNKAVMRRALHAAGVPQPAYRVASAGCDVVELAHEVGWPCVLKPVSLAASRGVIRANDAREAIAASERIRAVLAAADRDPSEPLLIEAYVPGPEVVVEGLLRGGELEVLAVLDKPDPLEGPFFEETLFITPSRLAPRTRGEIERQTAAATAALGLTEGPIHAELRVGPDGARVLEIAARSIGGLCSRSLRFGLGASLEEVILRHALGLSLDHLERERGASGVMMLPIPRAGVLKEVRGVDQARAIAGITEVVVTLGRMRPVQPLPEGDRYLGFMFARADSPAEVEAALRAAHARLEVVIEDQRQRDPQPTC
ncbi:ATP-grasp domain-containing protein [soil metagenome]